MRDPQLSARAMDNARAQGLPDRLLRVHLAVVAAHRGLTPWPPTELLHEYVTDKRVRGMDEIAWAAARRHLTSTRQA